MKCIAREMGFVNGSRVRPGVEFEAAKCPKWAVEAEKAPKPAPEKSAKKEPRTLSEMGKQTAVADEVLLARKARTEEDLTG